MRLDVPSKMTNDLQMKEKFQNKTNNEATKQRSKYTKLSTNFLGWMFCCHKYIHMDRNNPSMPNEHKTQPHVFSTSISSITQTDPKQKQTKQFVGEISYWVEISAIQCKRCQYLTQFKFHISSSFSSFFQMECMILRCDMIDMKIKLKMDVL